MRKGAIERQCLLTAHVQTSILGASLWKRQFLKWLRSKKNTSCMMKHHEIWSYAPEDLRCGFLFVTSNAPSFMVLKGSVSQTVFSEKIKAICSVRLPWQNPMAVVLVGWISTAMNSQIQGTISFTSTESYLQPGILIWPSTQLPTYLGKAIDLKLDDVFSSYASDLHRHCVKDTGRDLLLCKVSMLTI